MVSGRAAGDSRAEPVVVAENVRRTYYLGEPVHALQDASLSLPAGSFTAVMGPSGSGKSTLMNLLGCLDTPDEGSVEIDGHAVAELSGAKRARLRGSEIGFVFQTFNLMPRLTAAENVTLPMVFNAVVDEGRRERARTLLERVGLSDRLDHVPTELSGGQRQRVAIARALANEPTLVLADEPTGNLDTDTGAEIMALFEELHDAGRTILMVTHERHVAEHAERIVHVVDGQIRETEDVSDVEPSMSASGASHVSGSANVAATAGDATDASDDGATDGPADAGGETHGTEDGADEEGER